MIWTMIIIVGSVLISNKEEEIDEELKQVYESARSEDEAFEEKAES